MSSRDEASLAQVLTSFRQVSEARSRSFSAQTGIPLARLGAPITFRLSRGCVALYRDLSDERRQILDVFGPGWVISGEHVDLHACRAMAICESRVEEIETEQNAEVINEAARRMLKRAQAHGLLLGRKTAAERVASTLLDLAGQFARHGYGRNSGQITFLLHLSHYELADWLGLTQETVSRCLSRLKRDRVIGFNQPELITIRDPQALRTLATGATPAA
ncbi:helix-turn-helix domain-containing protein [Rhizobium oryzicola]|uniref:Helix-turn-helix domain-containing protein n=1 Tax=Rhizobium oryzicola TaxID=1232668 RepID=A0ABT8SX55_9HYPH|nr:helix-turn-helix domain-containing protein [Rhizobium oryzicola]MDO1582576.1 helix-turn-helix domain-containing protein [Rhizobium oryzicola]